MKIKFNSIDLLIIILLIAVTAAGGWFMTNRGKQSALSSNKTVEVTVELTDKDKAFTELPKIGDQVVLGEKVKMNAIVTKVDIKNATMLGYDTLGGRILDSEIPEHYDVQITVQAPGVGISRRSHDKRQRCARRHGSCNEGKRLVGLWLCPGSRNTLGGVCNEKGRKTVR